MYGQVFLVHMLCIQLRPLESAGTPQAQLDGRLDYDQPIVLLPLLMSPDKQCLDCLPVLAGAHFLITKPGSDILGSILVSMCRVTANSTTKRLLIGSVSSVHVMAHMTFL